MWGKLTDRNNRTRTKFIIVLYTFVATPGVEVTYLAFSNDDMVWHSWKVSAEENVANLLHTNEVIEAYVTVGARNH
jgi:hypothetical protein